MMADESFHFSLAWFPYWYNQSYNKPAMVELGLKKYYSHFTTYCRFYFQHYYRTVDFGSVLISAVIFVSAIHNMTGSSRI